MKASDRAAFAQLVTSALAFWRTEVTDFTLGVWWSACQPFSLEQVEKALTQHAMDPERGRFAPFPADIVKALQGTHTDRALVAWGKVYEAIRRTGAYESVQFDDPAIHAALVDMGGWPTVCRTQVEDLPFVQKRFCELHRSMTGRESFEYPSRLAGAHELENAASGRGEASGIQILEYRRGHGSAPASIAMAAVKRITA